MASDPYTCRHPVRSMQYTDNGSRCRDCKRRWWVWTTADGRKMMMTEPKYGKPKAGAKKR